MLSLQMVYNLHVFCVYVNASRVQSSASWASWMPIARNFMTLITSQAKKFSKRWKFSQILASRFPISPKIVFLWKKFGGPFISHCQIRFRYILWNLFVYVRGDGSQQCRYVLAKEINIRRPWCLTNIMW